MMRRRFLSALAVTLFSIGAATAWSQVDDGVLPRRAALGVPLAIDAAGAVVVTAVPEGSAAAEAGMLVGDAITALGGAPVTSTAQVQSIIGGHRGGDSLAIDVARNGETEHLVAELKSFAPTDAPRPAPAVLYLQGGGCGSIDVPWAGSTGPNALVHAIALRGFETMRVDKPGVGDSEGPPCVETGFREELAGYRAALRALSSDPAVDPERVFLLGVSLGGFFAPLLAGDVHVAGISAYGTIAFTPTPYPGRSERFFREIADVDILAAWAAVDTRVQLLHGTFDDRTTASDHAKIAAIVNQAHPGLAEHRELEGLDHCWTRHETLEASLDNCGGGEETADLSDTVLEFIGKR